jgi:hypothetical protein
VLPVDPQRFAAGQQQVDGARVGRERLHQRRHLVGDVFAVVQHHQLVADGQHLYDPIGDRARTSCRQPQCCRERRLDVARPPVPELHEQHAVVVPVPYAGGHVDGEPRLPHPARSAQRDDPAAREQVGGCGEVALASDERADRQRWTRRPDRAGG